jgi:hypothetical protein
VAVLLVMLSGCTWKGEGLIERTGIGPTLVTPTGKRFKLVHGPEDAAIAGLDGYRVLIEGRRAFGALNVRDWQVPEGLTGMPVFIGVLERKGVQLGLTDQSSGAFVFFDQSSWEELAPFVGRPVAVEGWIDGPSRVRVLEFESLEPRDQRAR